MPEENKFPNRFDHIYSADLWEGGSGPGSTPSSTIPYRAFVESFMFDNRVRSVVDLGCGDWQFSRYMNWSSVDYIGIDVVDSVIKENSRAFGTEKIKFAVIDDPEKLPGGDLVLCKEVLQHLPNVQVNEYLSAMQRRYRFCLITNSISGPREVNCDISPGDFRPLRIEEAPFFAAGAHVLAYYPFKEKDSWMMRNSVFLMLGDKTNP